MFRKVNESIMLFLALLTAGFDADWSPYGTFDYELSWIFKLGYFDLGNMSIKGDETTFKKVAKIVHIEGWNFSSIDFYSSFGYAEHWDKVSYRWKKDENPVSNDMWILRINKEGENQTIYIHTH